MIGNVANIHQPCPAFGDGSRWNSGCGVGICHRLHKSIKIIGILAITAVSAIRPIAGETNNYFVTDDGTFFSHSSGKGKPQMIEAARTNRECQSSERFAEGNWGLVNNGFQLSLRFDKDTYTNGEPITAVLLIRNVTNQSVYLCYNPFPIGYADGPVGFSVATEDGRALTQRKYIQRNGSASSCWLANGTQHKYQERLDKRFDLTNGIYLVQAVKIGACLPWPGITTNTIAGANIPQPDFKWDKAKSIEVKSAEVKIQIFDPGN